MNKSKKYSPVKGNSTHQPRFSDPRDSRRVISIKSQKPETELQPESRWLDYCHIF